MKNALSRHKLPLLIASLLLLAVLAYASWFAWGRRDFWLPELVHLRDAGLDLLRSVHPLTFFLLLAILPVFPVPIMPFYLSAGIYPIWISIPVLMAGVSCNLALSYWLAESLMRPFALKVLQRWNFRLPQVTPKNEKVVNVIVRVSGLPYAAQNYICALSGVSFRTYMLVGVPLQLVAGIAFMLVGDSLMNGRAGNAIIGVSLLVLMIAGTKLLKDHLEKRRRLRADPGASI